MKRRWMEKVVGPTMVGLVWVFGLGMEAMAQSADRIVEDGADFLITRMGPALFLVGIAIAGISLAVGNVNAVRKGAYVVAGGIIVMAARAIFETVASFAR